MRHSTILCITLFNNAICYLSSIYLGFQTKGTLLWVRIWPLHVHLVLLLSLDPSANSIFHCQYLYFLTWCHVNKIHHQTSKWAVRCWYCSRWCCKWFSQICTKHTLHNSPMLYQLWGLDMVTTTHCTPFYDHFLPIWASWIKVLNKESSAIKCPFVLLQMPLLSFSVPRCSHTLFACSWPSFNEHGASSSSEVFDKLWPGYMFDCFVYSSITMLSDSLHIL